MRSAADHLLGQRVRCPECDELVEISLLADSESQRIPYEGEVIEKAASETRAKKGRSSKHAGAQVASDRAAATPVPEIELSPLPAIDMLNLPPPTDTNGSGGDGADELEPVEMKKRVDDSEMDMTPMVDVTFLLLIFFLITASFAMQKAMSVPKPKENEASTQQSEEIHDKQFVTVTIDEHNTFVVTMEGDEFEAPTPHELRLRLHAAKASGGLEVTKLVVKSHEKAMLESLVTVLDAGSDESLTEIEVSTFSGDEG